jgi:hypothetical protein
LEDMGMVLSMVERELSPSRLSLKGVFISKLACR